MLQGERNLKRKAVLGIVLTLLFAGVLTLAFNIQPVEASGTIYIKADGSIDPPTANITSVDNVTYTFTDNIVNQSIVVQRSNIIIDGDGNTLSGPGIGIGNGIIVPNSTYNNVTIRNTNIEYFDNGVLLSSTFSCAISASNLTNNYSGIRLYNSNYSVMINNNCSLNVIGISLSNSSENILSNNHCSFSEMGIGIVVYDSNDNTLVNNTVNSNCEGGISLYGNFNTITKNNVNGTYAGHGIALGGNNNTISQNNITNNGGAVGEGMYLSHSANNTIHHNNFINNTWQVYNIMSNNTWDDGYPSGGNYWSNYTGVDVKNGPSQNQDGSDGIGDTPHVIDANNTDHYPLMNPLTPIETFVEVWGVVHPVLIDSNTTIDQIGQTGFALHFTSSGQTGDTGYVLLTFPMIAPQWRFGVFIDGVPPQPPFPIISDDGINYFIYFEFTLSSHNITFQFSPPVGGIYIPVNKLELLAPYIGLTILLAVAVVAVVYVKKRKRHTEINS